jgi:hypothetical protein
VREVRIKARRRLIGVTLLLVIGIIGFPLLFETQPRPIPVDIPIEIPARDGAAPLHVAAPDASSPAWPWWRLRRSNPPARMRGRRGHRAHGACVDCRRGRPRPRPR